MPIGLAFDSLRTNVRLTSMAYAIVPIDLAFDSLRASVRLTSIAYEIVPIGLALIVYQLVSVLT